VRRDHGVEGQRAEEFLEQFGVHLADLRTAEVSVEDHKRTAGDVDRGLGQGLVHRDQALWTVLVETGDNVAGLSPVPFVTCSCYHGSDPGEDDDRGAD
jgi:hypothetical protein